MVLANNRISFPVTEPFLRGDDGRALIDAIAIRQLATSVVFAVAFAPLFLAAEMLVEVAALALVGIDVLIDALVRGGRLALCFERAAKLIGLPILLHTGFDLLPSLGGDARGIGFGRAARVVQ